MVLTPLPPKKNLKPPGKRFCCSFKNFILCLIISAILLNLLSFLRVKHTRGKHRNFILKVFFLENENSFLGIEMYSILQVCYSKDEYLYDPNLTNSFPALILMNLSIPEDHVFISAFSI